MVAATPRTGSDAWNTITIMEPTNAFFAVVTVTSAEFTHASGTLTLRASKY